MLQWSFWSRGVIWRPQHDNQHGHRMGRRRWHHRPRDYPFHKGRWVNLPSEMKCFTMQRSKHKNNPPLRGGTRPGHQISNDTRWCTDRYQMLCLHWTGIMAFTLSKPSPFLWRLVTWTSSAMAISAASRNSHLNHCHWAPTQQAMTSVVAESQLFSFVNQRGGSCWGQVQGVHLAVLAVWQNERSRHFAWH